MALCQITDFQKLYSIRILLIPYMKFVEQQTTRGDENNQGETTHKHKD